MCLHIVWPREGRVAMPFFLLDPSLTDVQEVPIQIPVPDFVDKSFLRNDRLKTYL